MEPFGHHLAPSWAQVAPQIGQVAPKERTKSIRYLQKSKSQCHFWGVLVRTCFQERSQAPFWMDFGPIWASFFYVSTILRSELRQNTEFPKHETRGQEPTTNLTRSNKINQTIAKHKPANTTHRNRARHAEPQNEGAAVSRRMASSIRSGPGGARGVFEFGLVSLSGINLIVV